MSNSARPAGQSAREAPRTAGPAPADPRRRPVVAALMLAMALAALDSTIIATAIPQIVGDLGGFAVFSWLFSGYLLAVTVTLPVYGKLSDTFGRKPILLTGIVLFLAGSLACAGAWNMASLIAFRVLQGLGGGALQGTVQTIAADLYPMKERPRIQARLSSVWAVSSVAGPALGGLLAACADWRWIFLVNAPVGAVALWLIVRYFSEPERDRHGRRARRPRVDWPGALAIFACGGLLLTALVQGGVAWPWYSAPSLLLFAGSALCATVTVLIERRAAEPIIPGWVWRRRTISAVNLALGALGLLMVAPTVFLPTYAQAVLGLGPTAAGFVLSVMTLSWPVSAALSSHVYNRLGIRTCAALGIGGAGLVLLAFPLLPYPGAAWQPALIMLALGAALGLFQLPLIIGVQSSVGYAERGTATASILFCRQVGQSLGAALFGALANATLNDRLAHAPSDIRPGLPGDLDAVSHALQHPGALTARATDYLRHAVDTTVDHVYLGAAAAAGLALAALLLLAPRRFPVHSDARGTGEGEPGAT
ncbi:drug resistance transporter, EmrB/QacA subfamily [Streptomyces sp. 2224.1]|nr:EmrB/QacA subfamily drug resistance transporter [Streptomyces sp. 2321.6]SDR46688.1 drug resistance transporter, EmrB/QacA subfamily [Streptomyces sp. KS_16]SEC30480.1 drug resistance transporter, EmrB/QacA subfamily [Streptomyces sp. 2224.1]SEC74214.1 drug resistance transporter, EmrB/QacA subfamily [Streptomyces sp. 2133.1]SEE91112.1 drug resistance transporter, EmrB/QacA subfamily [Streptomyces sp. 2112.3]SNC68928.1 drug resistance transporter, EmrB/QacA subfamily [Streptomyces sp. 2114.